MNADSRPIDETRSSTSRSPRNRHRDNLRGDDGRTRAPQLLNERPEVLELKPHVIHDRAVGAGGRLLLSKKDEDVGESDAYAVVERHGLAAQGFPERHVLFHVIDHDVVVSHRDGVGLGSDELRRRGRSGERHH